MKILILFTIGLIGASSFASETELSEPTVLTGKIGGSGGECTLTVDAWGFNEGQGQGWWSMTMSVRSSFQFEGNPSIKVSQSPTPWALYGKNKEYYDQIAINLRTSGDLDLGAIQSYQFQSWDEERGLVQKSCRFY